ncbi:GGDEF domain-containing protein [Massilia sp. PWRC2]|uniref:GGDEF domain-containing protein n=1 Tax=Massilia sp. PWRC2 TaxID=2804626 RepID=UPI003CF1ED0B
MDISTMLLALALGNMSLCAALFFYEHGRPQPVAMRIWLSARQLQAGAWLLLYLRLSGVLPDALSIPLGYCLLFFGVALEAGALWEANGQPHWRRRTLWALVLAVGLFLACYAIDPAGLRQVAGALIAGAAYLSCSAAFAARWREASLLRRFLAIAIAVLAVLVAARGVLALVAPGGWGWVSNGLLQLWASAAFYLLMVLGAFGFLLVGRERLQQEIERLQVADPVTGVSNRRGFFMAVAPWLALARRPGVPAALIAFDLDNFRRVNDSYGHAAGDTALHAVIDICKQHLRDSDQIGRLVGVEFAILLPRTELAAAVLVAERMRAAVAATPSKSARAMVALTASFGVTTVRGDDSTTSLFKRADDAVQAAKQAGRNCVMAAPAAPQTV